jgi:hypothetical protein
VETRLRGVVFEGQGLAKGWMEKDPLLSVTLGVKLHPGSINFFVSGDYRLFDQDISPNCVRNAGHLRALPCVVRRGDARRNGFIVRTEFQGPRTPIAIPQPNTMLEILAESHLRTDLGLGFGETPVEIEFDPSQTKSYPVKPSQDPGGEDSTS